MSIEKITELTKLAKQMEEMKTNAINSITDRKELRIQAIKKIQSYLTELSEATSGYGWTANTNTTIYWLVKQSEIGARYNGVSFHFNSNGNVDIFQNSSCSSLKINDFTNITEEEFFESYDKNRWREGFIQLIEKWQELKPQIEESAERSLLERMNKTQKELADFKASYEHVVNFEV